MGLDFAKMGQNLLSSATGNVSKAILVVRKIPIHTDEFGQDTIDQIAVDDIKGAINDMAGAPEEEGKGGLNHELMELARQSLKNGKTASFDTIAKKAKAKNFIALELQYNPTSIRFDTTAGRQMNYSGEAGSPQVQQYTAPASTTLSCELLFDNVNNMDAFMVGDNPITGMTASNIKNAAMSAFKGEYSVQRQMEGLISLLSVPSARHVIFYWGAMCFRGEVTEVTTKYTMFNKKGYPIRGTAGIQIRQGDGSPGAREPDLAYRYDDSYWDDSFKKTFTDEGKGQSAWKAATNNSLLNLKL